MDTPPFYASQESTFSSHQIRRSEFRRGAIAVLPVLLGAFPYAMVMGAQAVHKGLSLLSVMLMAGMNFAGGSEFSAIRLWTSPPHVLLIAAITFLVNSRHLLMGAALAPFISHLPKRTAFISLFLMCDESWALGLADAKHRQSKDVNPALSLKFYMGVAIPFYVAWLSAATLGAVLGPMVGDLRPYGFDMAFPAVFLVLLAGMWKGFKAARPWFVSLAVAAVTYLTIPGAWYVAAGAVSGLVAAYLLAGAE
ncbi:AzlC family ABC transporter permease [Ochrobactrum teleogrylli]|uniref:AzlC family ABC transporter permease n=1 Tax=Ochrobactrum teleogrylli TaxID=2479765 RepID=A0ABY2YAA7_9HYPH|nr:AzlC family ABC transporter permease [[Ochrobactrum] teleogrylli]TNV18739.1 AzlC family ABC transporter permease [[Ochrobactrum] teleogrylli]